MIFTCWPIKDLGNWLAALFLGDQKSNKWEQRAFGLKKRGERDSAWFKRNLRIPSHIFPNCSRFSNNLQVNYFAVEFCCHSRQSITLPEWRLLTMVTNANSFQAFRNGIENYAKCWSDDFVSFLVTILCARFHKSRGLISVNLKDKLPVHFPYLRWLIYSFVHAWQTVWAMQQGKKARREQGNF